MLIDALKHRAWNGIPLWQAPPVPMDKRNRLCDRLQDGGLGKGRK